MSIFIDNTTTLLVQGITGRDGSFHAKQMMEYGTCVVGGMFTAAVLGVLLIPVCYVAVRRLLGDVLDQPGRSELSPPPAENP